MRRHTHHLITAALVGVLLLSGWKTARAAAVWSRAPHAGERTGLATPRNAPVRAPAGSPLAEVARAERAIVFVYLPDCQVCHANMANWIDLVGETRDADVELYAVAPAHPAQSGAAREYWAGLDRHVRVITATPAAVHAAFDVGNTPATLMVQKGQVRGEILGALTPAGKAEVLRFARGGPAHGG
jgi:hypothetical protein